MIAIILPARSSPSLRFQRRCTEEYSKCSLGKSLPQLMHFAITRISCKSLSFVLSVVGLVLSLAVLFDGELEEEWQRVKLSLGLALLAVTQFSFIIRTKNRGLFSLQIIMNYS
jgi:hypothetical protein